MRLISLKILFINRLYPAIHKCAQATGFYSKNSIPKILWTNFSCSRHYYSRSLLENMDRNYSVIIVGAGAAGMSATAKLLSSGISNVTVLEAASRIGGRIHSTSFGPNTIDLGAQWVHGEEDNIVYSMANPANEVEGSAFNVISMLCANSSGEIIDIETSQKLFSIFYRIHEEFADEKGLKGSFGEYFIEKFNSELKKDQIVISDELKQSFIELLHQFENSVDGSDSWFNTSAPGLQDYKECGGNPLIKWKKGGYSSVFRLIETNYGLKGTPSASKVQFGKEVTAIEWDRSSHALVRCSDGSSYYADHVLVAVSLGVLKEKSNSIFDPPLPSYKQVAIQALGFGTVDKIFVRFPHRWWSEEHTGFSFLWTSIDRESQEFEKRNLGWAKDVFGFFTVDNLPEVLCGWVVGKSARQMEAESDQKVMDVMYELLNRFFGKNFTIPKPTSILRSTWFSNPHTRGSYSFRTVDSELLNASAAQLSDPVVNSFGKQVLFFAGEATHPYYYSTVHGAVETGLREADRIASIYSRVEKEEGDKSVVIVGAGIAGLAACRTLLDAGITDIVLLEGQNYAGGRVLSVPIAVMDGGWAELGAHWIHGQHNPIYEIASAKGLVSNQVSAEGLGKYLYLDGEEIPMHIVHEVEGIVGDILEECENYSRSDDCAPPSVGDYLLEKFTKYLQECDDSSDVYQMKMDLFEWHIRFQVIDNSCDNLNDLSAKFWGCYKFSGGLDYNNFKAGYSSLVESLIEDLPPTLLKLNCAVKRIIINNSKNFIYEQNNLNNGSIQRSKQSSHPVTVLCENGMEYRTSHVIVTSSLGFLKKNHKTMFSPPLPHFLVKAIDSMGFNVINKIFLIYDEPWWNSDDKGFQIMWRKKQFDCLNHKEYWLRNVTGFDVLSNFDNVLLGWVGGEGAIEMEELTEEEISRHCTNLFRKITKRNDLPLPIQLIRSQWHKNRFVCGGYSHTTKQCDLNNDQKSLRLPVVIESALSNQHPAILLAGEATHDKYFSTTHGAFESGENQAKHIISFMESVKKA